MLNLDLERMWESATEEEKKKAKARAELLLGNLVHYPIDKKRYYIDDLEQVAANLLAYQKEK